MDRFAWQAARTPAEAAGLATGTVADAMLAAPGAPGAAVLKAGGIDLLDLMKEGLLHPAVVVNLRDIPGLDAIAEDGAGGLRVGALATLEQLGASSVLRERYPALAEAAGGAASPQLRHVATLGGNLLQRPQCWYFRSPAHPCLRRGGTHCFAFAGENAYHAVLGHPHCAIVHPSTAATALAAFAARVELVDAAGAVRVVPLASLLVGPETDVHHENTLRAGEVLTAVLLPPLPASARSVYLKQAEKPAFDWPIAEVAVVLDLAADGRCLQAAVVLGAAAPVPWRATAAEAALLGRPIDAATAHAAGQAAVTGAEPLRQNAYKLPILATLVRRAVLRAAGALEQETPP